MVSMFLQHDDLCKFGPSSILLGEEQDDCTPLEYEDDVIDTENQSLQPSSFQMTLPEHPLRAKRFPLPVRHVLNWELNYAPTDISSYLVFSNSCGSYRRGPIQLTIPSVSCIMNTHGLSHSQRPYYSPHLQFNINTISHTYYDMLNALSLSSYFQLCNTTNHCVERA